MRLKDQIKLIKSALKKDQLYSESELQYMVIQLARAKVALKIKQQRRKQEKGFSNEFSETRNSNSRSGEDNGVRSESIEPEQPGEP